MCVPHHSGTSTSSPLQVGAGLARTWLWPQRGLNSTTMSVHIEVDDESKLTNTDGSPVTVRFPASRFLSTSSSSSSCYTSILVPLFRQEPRHLVSSPCPQCSQVAELESSEGAFEFMYGKHKVKFDGLTSVSINGVKHKVRYCLQGHSDYLHSQIAIVNMMSTP